MALARRAFEIFRDITDTVNNIGMAMDVPARSIHVGMWHPALATTDEFKVTIVPTKAPRIKNPLARKSTPGVTYTILMSCQRQGRLVGNCRKHVLGINSRGYTYHSTARHHLIIVITEKCRYDVPQDAKLVMSWAEYHK